LPEGMLFRLFIIGYFGLRFFLEFLKERHDTVFLLSAIQIVCLVTCTFYLYDAARNLSSREDK
jgi:prolipoprotein diacylglyceryltransferase